MDSARQHIVRVSNVAEGCHNGHCKTLLNSYRIQRAEFLQTQLLPNMCIRREKAADSESDGR